MQLIQSVWTGSRACKLSWIIGYLRDFLPILTESAVCIWRNSLVFHFAGSSIYNSFIYGQNDAVLVSVSSPQYWYKYRPYIIVIIL